MTYHQLMAEHHRTLAAISREHGYDTDADAYDKIAEQHERQIPCPKNTLQLELLKPVES